MINYFLQCGIKTIKKNCSVKKIKKIRHCIKLKCDDQLFFPIKHEIVFKINFFLFFLPEKCDTFCAVDVVVSNLDF